MFRFSGRLLIKSLSSPKRCKNKFVEQKQFSIDHGDTERNIKMQFKNKCWVLFKQERFYNQRGEKVLIKLHFFLPNRRIGRTPAGSDLIEMFLSN